MDLLFMSPVITQLLTSFPRIELDDGSRAAYFTEYSFGDEPVVPLDKAIEEGFDFAIPFFATMQALDIDMGEIREQVVYLCDVPLMLDKGYFLIDGVERVVPPKIEQLPDGTWRTHEIGEIFRERLMTGLDDVVLELKERLAETEWEGLIPQNLLDISPLVSSIQAIFNESGIEDHAYHEAAYDCTFDFHEEDTEPCPYDDEEAFELKVKYREESIDVSGPITFVGYLFSGNALSMQ